MRVEIRPTIEKLRAFGRRLIFRTSISPEQLVPPPQGDIENPATTAIEPIRSELTSAPSMVDYRAIALGYFSDVLKRSEQQGRSPDEILATLSSDSVLMGIKRRQIQQAIEYGTEPMETAEAIAQLLPENPRRDARRALVLWDEQSKRDKPENSSTSEVGKTNGKEAPEVAKAKPEIIPDEVETEKVRNYSLGKLYQKPIDPKKGLRYGVAEMTEEEVETYIKERAKKLGGRDERLATDFTAMIDLLRENPTPNGNLGVKRMSDKRVAIEGVSHPLWRFSPRRSQGLAISHPESEGMRIVYAIYRSNGTRVVVLDGDGIYTHGQFDKKYSTGKSSRR